MDNVRNYQGNYLLKTESWDSGIHDFTSLLNSGLLAPETKVFIFYFPVDTLAYVMDCR